VIIRKSVAQRSARPSKTCVSICGWCLQCNRCRCPRYPRYSSPQLPINQAGGQRNRPARVTTAQSRPSTSWPRTGGLRRIIAQRTIRCGYQCSHRLVFPDAALRAVEKHHRARAVSLHRRM
jgi:hypothetical protein